MSFEEDLLRVRAFFLWKYVNRGMAFHRLVVVASLPATFPTLGRVNPNMTEQAALSRVNLGQQTHILSSQWGVSKLGFSPVLFRNKLVSFQKELVLFKKNTQTFGLFILPLEKNRCWIFKNSIEFLYQVSSWIGLISFLIVRFYSISKSYIGIKFSSENNKHLCLSLILMI